MITTSENEKCCVDCKTTKTPLWRSGPSGPKSLCNACGIRHRKRRAAAGTASSTLSLNHGETTKKIKKRVNVRNGKSDKLCMDWRQRLMAFGDGFVLCQKQRSQMKKRQRIHGKLGEVEQAAVLLISLSCHSCGSASLDEDKQKSGGSKKNGGVQIFR